MLMVYVDQDGGSTWNKYETDAKFNTNMEEFHKFAQVQMQKAEYSDFQYSVTDFGNNKAYVYRLHRQEIFTLTGY